MGPIFNVSNSQCALSNQNMFEEFHESAPENKTFVVLKKMAYLTTHTGLELPTFVVTSRSRQNQFCYAAHVVEQ